MATVQYPHIDHTPDNIPIIAGTRIKVVEIVLDHLAHGWDAQEIQRQHPHLSLAQVYSCLAYYYDRQAEIDEDINRRLRLSEQILTELGPSPVRAKLRALGHLP